MALRRTKGEGTIYLNKKGIWVAQITLPDGKRKTKYSKEQKSVRDWLLVQRGMIKDGLFLENESTLFSALLDRWYNDVAVHNLRPKTLEAYESLIRNHINPELGRYKLNGLKPVHLQNFYSQKLNSGLSKRSVQFMHSIIHRALEQGLIWGVVVRNVADAVTAPKPDKTTQNILNVLQIKKLFEVLRCDRLYPFYVLAISTGMRRGELLALKWEDVDFSSHRIYVRRNLSQINGKGLVIGEPKSEKSRRPIALPQFALDVLLDHRIEGKSDFVFATGNGTPFSPRNVLRHFKETLKKAGLPEETRLHDLRHTFASLLLAADVHPKIVQEALGHSSVTITLDTYSHLLPNIQKGAADKLDDMFK